MTNYCNELHKIVTEMRHFSFPYNEEIIPENGIYILFEKGELGHGGNRIVRIGTHTGANQLRSRLRQHFLTSNKDRSIFRKNIGRCFLNRRKDPYLGIWELDMTSKGARETSFHLVDTKKQKVVEDEISEYMRDNFFFCVLEVKEKDERLALESKIISTVSHCPDCSPSPSWLGQHSTKEKIRASGLWLVNELYKKPLTKEDLLQLRKMCLK